MNKNIVVVFSRSPMSTKVHNHQFEMSTEFIYMCRSLEVCLIVYSLLQTMYSVFFQTPFAG